MTDRQEVELTKLARPRRRSVWLARRAQILLLAAHRLQYQDIGQRLGVGHVQVARWRQRYLQSELQGIERDWPHGAPPVKMDVACLIELTTQSTPEAAMHGFSVRRMRVDSHAALQWQGCRR